MKMRRSIFWFVLIAIGLILFVLWHGKRPAQGMPDIASSATNDSLPSASGITAATQSGSPSAQAGNGGDFSKPPLLNKAAKEIGILSDYNDQPIVFYGKVEDQFTNAVDGAEINFEVRIINGIESTVQRGQVISDANGLFTISGYHGQDLAMAVKKGGYTFVAMNGSGDYSKLSPEGQRAHPDIANPTVIKMWKLVGPESLMAINQTFKLNYMPSPVNFDLIAGQIVPTGGDLQIVVTRAPGIITQRRENHGDWSIELLPVNGGLIKTDYHTAQVTYEAPADGYQNRYFVKMAHDDPGWFDNVNDTFFMTSKNGTVFSKFSLSFKINDDPNDTMWLQFKGVANTNSSRNWEATAPQ